MTGRFLRALFSEEPREFGLEKPEGTFEHSEEGCCVQRVTVCQKHLLYNYHPLFANYAAAALSPGSQPEALQAPGTAQK